MSVNAMALRLGQTIAPVAAGFIVHGIGMDMVYCTAAPGGGNHVRGKLPAQRPGHACALTLKALPHARSLCDPAVAGELPFRHE